VSGKLIIGLKKFLNVAFALLIGAILLGVFLITVWPPLPPPAPDESPVPGNTPVIFYVGSHAFKLPRDYSNLAVSDYDGPGNYELIFDFSYPWFTAPYEDTRVNMGHGIPIADNALLEIYLMNDGSRISYGAEELREIAAKTTTDWLKPGPYQLAEVHEKDDSDWILTRHYIGILNGIDVDISCGNPNFLKTDGTRDDLCVSLYPYNDLTVEESFSVPNLAHWKEVFKKTVEFLKTHEVK